MKRKLADQIVVITGASSGIGRACAIEMVRRGATVVGVARDSDGLASLAASLASAKGQIEVAQVDVADPQQVEQLANATVERYGRIDTWVNNAAVAMFAAVADSTAEEIRRIMDVNFLGQVHGMKAALAHMRPEGRGTIINIGSVASRRAVPLLSAYSASKHALAAFTDALRMELEYEGTGVDVTLILPASINTPVYEHARSKLGALPSPVRPVYQPSAVAEAVLFAAERPRRDIVVGGAGAALIVLQRISPRFLDWYMVQGGRFLRKQRSSRPDDGKDNLFEPMHGPGEVRGVYGEGALNTSPYTRVFEHHPIVKAVALTLLAPLAADAAIVALTGAGLLGLAARLFRPLLTRGPREGRPAGEPR